MARVFCWCVLPVVVSASGWWNGNTDFDGPWYNSLFVLTPMTSPDPDIVPMNFSDVCPANVPLAPLSVVNWQGALHTMQDANGTLWNGYNGYGRFEYFDAVNDVFLSQGAMAYTSVTQLYDAYVTYATDTIDSDDPNTYGSSLPDAQSTFASTLLEFYKTAVNPCFFHRHVWNQYTTNPGAVPTCSLPQQPDAPWSQVPFVNLQFPQYPQYSASFLTMQVLTGTFFGPGSSDDMWKCSGSQVWAGYGAVPAINRLFTCGDTTCGPFANTENASATSLVFEGGLYAYDIEYYSRTGIRKFIESVDGVPFFETLAFDSTAPRVNAGLFLNPPRFLIRSNDNARSPMEFSHSAAKGVVQRSFPPSVVSPYNTVCYNSPVGVYNDVTHTANTPLVDAGSEGLCFYAYNEVFGNTAEALRAYAGAYVSGAPPGENTLDYLDGRETGSAYPDGMAAVRSEEDCYASGAPVYPNSGYKFCPETGVTYCANSANYTAASGFVECNLYGTTCPSVLGLYSDVCPTFNTRYGRGFDTLPPVVSPPGGNCVERVRYDADVGIGYRQVLCTCMATDTPCNIHPEFYQCYNTSYPSLDCNVIGYQFAYTVVPGSNDTTKPLAPSAGPFPLPNRTVDTLVDFDPVHCALVETPGFYSKSVNNDVQTPGFVYFQRRVAEKPMFLDPRPAACNPNLPDRPLGLTQPQLETWCNCAASQTTCDASRVSIRYSLCYYNYTLGACTLRMQLREYVTDMTTRSLTTTSVPNPLCNTWNPELHQPYLCQRPDAFTGCVLVESQPIANAYYTSSTSDTAGTSIAVPNTLERLSVFPRVTSIVRTYVTMNAFPGQCLYRGVFPRYKLGINGDLLAFPCVLVGALTCRYVDAYGVRDTLTIDLSSATADTTTGKFTASILGGPRNISIGVFAELYTTGDTSTLALECEPSTDVSSYSVVYALPTIISGDVFSRVYNHTATTVVGGAALLSRTCVPLTWKIEVNASSYPDQIAQGHIYRTSPTNCVAVENQLIPEAAYGSSTTTTTALCKSATTGIEWMYNGLPCTVAESAPAIVTNAINLVTNIPTSTVWFELMRSYGYAAYFFDLNADPTTIVPGTGACAYNTAGDSPQRCTASSDVSVSACPITTDDTHAHVEPYDLAAFNNQHSYCLQHGTCAPADFVVPDCVASSATTGCAIALDRSFLNPCAVLATSAWNVCQKPTMQLFFPQWDPNNPFSADTPFLYPTTAFKSPGFTVEDQLSNGLQTPSTGMLTSRWSQQYWSQYLSYVHYCDQYYNGFTYCDNDPLSITQRQQLCDTYKPRYVYTGMSLVQFSLEDVCPHLAFPTLPSHCFVFPGDPLYGTIAQILAVKSFGNDLIDWSDTTFYLVPFNITVLQQLLIDPTFADTLLTNSVQAQNIAEALPSNLASLGANGIKLLAPIVSVINPDNFFDLHSVCQRNVPLTTATIQVVYDILLAVADQDPQAESFTFVRMETLEGIDPLQPPYITLPRSQVFPGFFDTGTRIPYNNIQIVPALTHVTIAYQPISVVASQTGYVQCSRFYVDGAGFRLSNITFDQTGCNNVPQPERTPIVFSGAFAQSAAISNITVINGEVAVAVLGADSDQYAYQPLVDAANNILSNISFSYTDESIPHQNRYVYGVYARAVGVATAVHCENNVLPIGMERTLGCAVQKRDTIDPCLFPGQCLNMTVYGATYGYHTAPNATNNPCCRNSSGTWQVVYSPVRCIQGFMCAYKNSPSGSTTDPYPTPGNYPNYRIVCSESLCNCAADASCVVTHPDYPHVLACSQDTTSVFLEGSNQTWEYDPAAEVGYSSVNPSIPADVLGVGFGPYWWTLHPSDLSDYPLVAGVPLRVGNASEPDTLLLYVTPNTNDPDGTDVRLTLRSDDFFANIATDPNTSAAYYSNRAFFDALYGPNTWCVQINASTRQLELALCTDNSTRFYIDAIDTRIHVSGTPFLCIHASDNGFLFLQPCVPCAVGSESHLLCASTDIYNQWFSYIPNATIYSLWDNTPVTTAVDYETPVGVDPFTLLYQAHTNRTRCLTVNTLNGSVFYAHCDPCVWESTQLRLTQPELCRTARGAQQLACSRHISSGLFATIGVPDFCAQDSGEMHADGIMYGIGGMGVCVNNVFVITKPGYGYFVYEQLNITLPNGTPVSVSLRAQTRKVLLQPYGNTSFNINTRGLEIINVSEYTSIFGRAIERGLYRAPPEYKTLYIVGNLLMLIANLFVILLHIVLIFYSDAIRTRLVKKQD